MSEEPGFDEQAFFDKLGEQFNLDGSVVEEHSDEGLLAQLAQHENELTEDGREDDAPISRVNEVLEIIRGRREDERGGRSGERRAGRHPDERAGRHEAGREQRPIAGLLDDGRRLVLAAIQDEKNLDSKSEFDVEALQIINNTLLDLTAGNGMDSTIPYRDAKLTREYFRRQAESIQVVGDISEEYQHIYAEISSGISDAFPTPESVFSGETPHYKFPDIDFLMEPLKKDEVTLHEAQEYFERFGQSIDSQIEEARATNPQWAAMMDGVIAADEYYDRHEREFGYDTPVYVIVKKPATTDEKAEVEIKPYDGKMEKYKTEDGSVQFIYERQEDGDFTNDQAELYIMAHRAKNAVKGVRDLMKDPPQIEAEDGRDMMFFFDQPREEMEAGRLEPDRCVPYMRKLQAELSKPRG